MRHWLLVLLVPFAAHAAPFVEADVPEGATECLAYIDAAPPVVVPVVDGTCKVDVGGVATGLHQVRMTARGGGVESTKSYLLSVRKTNFNKVVDFEASAKMRCVKSTGVCTPTA